MFFLTILGIVLRLFNINKPEGLWNDEYVSWYVSSFPFCDGFWQEILKQCHAPLYYIYLKPFVSCSDLILRFTSLIPGVLAIVIMYFVGKEFSKKCGYYAAAITSVLSFLVYYSQEVRFYSLLFLFSALSLLFTIKYLKNGTKENLTGYIISNLLIMLTHTIGFIFVFFNILYVIFKKKNINKTIILTFFIVFLILYLSMGKYIISMIPASQWWGHFSYTNILFLFTDYFSPILTNHINAPSRFFYNKDLTIWLVTPTLIAIIGLCFGAKKFKGLLYIAIGTILILSVAAIMGKLVFITKYSIEILPILLLVTAYGFEKLKTIGTILLTIFLAFHLFAAFTPNYVTLKPRNEGHKIVGDILKQQNSDYVLFTYYDENRFSRYINLENKKVKSISKKNRFEYKDNATKILDEINKAESVSIVFLDSISFLNEEMVKAQNPKIPEMFTTFSKIRIDLSKELLKNYTINNINKKGSWLVIKATKRT